MKFTSNWGHLFCSSVFQAMKFTSNWGHLFRSSLFSKHSFWWSSSQSKSLCCRSRRKWTIHVADYTDGANNIQAGRDRKDRQTADRQNTGSVSRAPHCINHYPKCKAERTSLVTVWNDRWVSFSQDSSSLGHNPFGPTFICHQLITLGLPWWLRG